MRKFFDPLTYLPLVNGLIGDKLAAKQDSWAIPCSFRKHGKDIPVPELDRRIRGNRIVVFVHGLMADEKVWKIFRPLERSFVTLHVRYNSGLHISTNGQLLANLLNDLETHFSPKRIALVGHSMGGLVIRSACYYAEKKQFRWTERVKAVFLIAVPNAGAALEKLSYVTASILNRIARWHIALLGNLIDQRSDGIKDLRLGSMLDEDWKSGSAHNRLSVGAMKGVRYHILVGSLSKDEKSLLAKYFGDGLVAPSSAIAQTLIQTSTVKIFPGSGHNSILANPKVVQYVKKILDQTG